MVSWRHSVIAATILATTSCKPPRQASDKRSGGSGDNNDAAATASEPTADTDKTGIGSASGSEAGSAQASDAPAVDSNAALMLADCTDGAKKLTVQALARKVPTDRREVQLLETVAGGPPKIIGTFAIDDFRLGEAEGKALHLEMGDAGAKQKRAERAKFRAALKLTNGRPTADAGAAPDTGIASSTVLFMRVGEKAKEPAAVQFFLAPANAGTPQEGYYRDCKIDNVAALAAGIQGASK